MLALGPEERKSGLMTGAVFLEVCVCCKRRAKNEYGSGGHR